MSEYTQVELSNWEDTRLKQSPSALFLDESSEDTSQVSSFPGENMTSLQEAELSAIFGFSLAQIGFFWTQ